MSLGAELRAALRGRGCRAMSPDIKVYTEGEMYYPNVTVVCSLNLADIYDQIEFVRGADDEV